MGYALIILQSSDDPQIELENLRICRMNRVAGVFVSITANTKDIKPFLKLDEVDIPVIFFDKVPDFEACNKICLADTEAATMAALTIIRKQKKKVLAIFGNEEMSISKKRKQAFLSVIESQSSSMEVISEHADNADDAFMLTLKYGAKTGFIDTIFSMSDEILTGVMRAIQKLKKNVPNEIGIISICNNNFIPRMYDPEISFVETSGADLGKLAIKRMMDHMSGKTFVQELTLPSRLVEGGSL